MKPEKKKLFIESLWITLAVYVVIAILGALPFNLHIFDSSTEAKQDVDLTDLYFSKILSAKKANTNIIILDIGQHDRSEIAKGLDLLSKHNPKVVGVDVFFKDTKDPQGDSALKSAFDQLANKIVIGGIFEPRDSQEASADFLKSATFFGDHPKGYINFVGEDSTSGTVRYFRPEQEGYFHFAVEVARKSDPTMTDAFLSRNKKTELINYAFKGKQFTTINLEDVLAGDEDLSVVDDKIVLVGLGGEVNNKLSIEDAHFTPLNKQLAGRSIPDMYGIYIHANIIAMIQGGNEITRFAGWWNFVFATIIGFIHILVYAHFYVHKHAWFHLTAKISQLITSILLMGISVFLMSANIKWEPELTMAVILLSVDVMYFYEGFRTYLHHKFNISSYFTHTAH